MASHQSTRSGDDIPFLQRIASLQSGLRDALASGTIPLEKEIVIRSQLADLLIRGYEQDSQGNVQHLRDATQHIDAILRRLPRESPERPLHLSRLSYACMSEYMATRSRFSIDEAVRYGRLARREAMATRLPENDIELYCEILNNLGVALSHRHQLDSTAGPETMEGSRSRGSSAGVAADLDEAIACAQEIMAHTAPGSVAYLTGLLNLTSRLEARYSSRNDPADRAEAVELLRQLQLISPPGSPVGGMATMQLGQMAAVRFERTDALEDLDDALRLIRDGLGRLTDRSELRPQCLHLVASLYSRRHKKTGNVEDLRNAISFSDMALASVPASHVAKGDYLLRHMHQLHDFITTIASIEEVTEVTVTAYRHLMAMPRDYKQRQNCHKLYGDVLGRKYLLSRKLEDLDEAVRHVEQTCYDYNGKVERSGTKPPVNISVVSCLSRDVRKLLQAPRGQAKDAGAEYLHHQIATACKSHGFANGILRIGQKVITILEVYADAARSKEAISRQQAEKRAGEIELDKATKLQDRRSRPWKVKKYETELGLRQLAIDPANKRIVMDLSTVMTDILGYDPTERVSETEFVERHIRLERDSIEKAKADGKHPNPALCRMCRFIKPLAPTIDHPIGFKWNQPWWPFGNWSQLKLRQQCTFCRLVLSLIVTDRGANRLHPYLAAIDPEIQGVSLHVGEVQATGEAVLSVEYGMREVGYLRMVTESNYTTALRQGWEAKEQHRESEGMVSGTAVDDNHRAPPPSWTNQQIDVRLLRHWLDDCELNHGKECNRSFHDCDESYNTEGIPMVFVDVLDNCLVRATSAVRYFALSYVWGAVDMCPTVVANYESRCQKGSLPRRLPSTIADAMALVRALGERYLWVDALCIVQDDAKRKMQDMAQMDVIYSRAFATVVALHGASADAGLPGVRPGTRPPQPVEWLAVDAGNEDLDYSPSSDGGPGRDEKGTVSLCLVATAPPLHLALEASCWDTRGWTFQERLLSRRCLYFADQYVYFQCGRWRDQVLSECGVNSPVRSKWTDKWVDESDEMAVVTTSLDNPLSDLHDCRVEDLEPQSRLAKTFATYTKLVEKYTLRQLSYEGDIINAFRGTFAALHASFQSDIICGLPTSALDLALLWATWGKTPRRGHTLATLGDPRTERRPVLGEALLTHRGIEKVWGPTPVQTFDEKVDRRFPSWSWVGWTGPVEYRLFADMRPEEPLPTSLIEEFTINLDGKKIQQIPGRKQPRGAPSLTSASAAPEDSAPSSRMERMDLNSSGVDSPVHASPSLPNVLQFMAPTVPLTTFTISTEREYISNKGSIHSPGRQAVRHILDGAGRRCGLWWEQAGYVYIGRAVSPAAEKKMLLVGVSRHEDTFSPRTGPSRVEGEIGWFDEDAYPAVGTGSGLINVLAVDLDMGHEFGERITVAKIHARAWDNAGPIMRMIRLA